MEIGEALADDGAQAWRVPNLLLFYDWPPSSAWGGLVLLSRLLSGYPSDRLTVLTGSYAYRTDTQDGRLSCAHVRFPTMKPRGLFGLGRVVGLIDYALIPMLILFGMWIVRTRKIGAIVTVAHGHFFIPAVFVKIATRVPYVLIVHDDWVSRLQTKTVLLRRLVPAVFRFAARRADHIYVVSSGMQAMLRSTYGVDSQVHLPAVEIRDTPAPRTGRECDGGVDDDHDHDHLDILYSGCVGAPVLDSVRLLVELVKGRKLASLGLTSWMLHLYVDLTAERARQLGWEHECVRILEWVSYEEIRTAWSRADILFLPFTFREDLHFITTRAFPSKTADYLSTGTPILIFAPPQSTIASYGREWGFAEIADEYSEDALASGIRRIWSSGDYRRELRMNAWRALQRNHDIAKQREEFRALMCALGDKRARQGSTAGNLLRQVRGRWT